MSIYHGRPQGPDYSIAKKGWLVAYTWDGEESLANKKFTWVKHIERH